MKWEVGQRWCPGHRRASNAKQSSTTIGLRVLLTRHQPNSLDHMLPVMFERAAAPVGALPDSWRADAQRAALGKVSGSLRWKEGSLVGAAAFLGREGWARRVWCRGRGGTAAGLGSPVPGWQATHILTLRAGNICSDPSITFWDTPSTYVLNLQTKDASQISF